MVRSTERERETRWDGEMDGRDFPEMRERLFRLLNNFYCRQQQQHWRRFRYETHKVTSNTNNRYKSTRCRDAGSCHMCALLHVAAVPLLLLVLPSTLVAQVDIGLCRYALGMQDGTIRDEDISASSEWYESTGARFARLNLEEGDGAWCADGPVTPQHAQFLQVDLRRLHVVTLVGTQGRHGNGLGNEFARAYRLEYSRDAHRWLPWRDRRGNQVIQGNVNTQDVVLKDLGPALVARFVRFVAVTDRAMSVCMRVELYGCPWADGLVSYSAPEGETLLLPSVAPANLNDSTYDGFIASRQMYGGLGQLTDGVWGLDDFALSPEHRVWPGYDYVGWSNGSLSLPYLLMLFEFDEPRNFSAMKVHCNNMFQSGVQTFREARCFFRRSDSDEWEGGGGGGDSGDGGGGGGGGGEDVGVGLVVEPDTVDPRARFITVPLGQRNAIAIKCHFYLGAAWLLISEISFHSAGTRVPGAPGATLSGRPMDTADERAPVLVACLVAIILLLVVIIALILWRHNWRKLLEKAPRAMLEDGMTVRLSLPCDTVMFNGRSLQRAGSALPQTKPPPAPPGGGLPPGYREPGTRPTRRLLHAERTLERAEGGGCGDYAEPELPLFDGAQHYAVADILDMQGVTGSSAYAVPAVPGDAAAAVPGHREVPPGHRGAARLLEVARETLRVREKLGEGQFGEVLLCEAVGLPRCVDDDDDEVEVREEESDEGGTRGGPQQPTLVAVKMLREDASSSARSDFLKEIKTMSRLRDAHVVRLVGVCLRDEPLCMLAEYMENGDLHHFLSAHRWEGQGPGPTLSVVEVLLMAVQVAAGMSYLASLNFVHRDLASRNCLVGPAHTIKIADFGMSRHLYSSDYYRIQGRAVLPIRWMAWESVLLGKFTTGSDVWAFGVTLWELLSLCQEQPYGGLTDELVIENAGELFRDNGRQMYLSQPPACPAPVYDLMLRCWRRESLERPTFPQIQSFLAQEAS
ncbi:unnamed protein product [Lampetra fluviatilis]